MTYELTIHTASWTAVYRHRQTFDAPRDMGFMPVRTSVGIPRFWPEAQGFPVAKLITPYGLRKLEGEAFTTAYLARLAEAGVEKITAELKEISITYGGKPLALLCFERQQSDCHRGMFAEWWEGQTGEVVTEIEPAKSALSNVGLAADLATTHTTRYGRQPQGTPVLGAERNP